MSCYQALKRELEPEIQVRKVFRFPSYAVTSEGKIYRVSGDKPELCPQYLSKSGYYTVWLRQQKRSPKLLTVHKIVARAFCGKKPGRDFLIRHLNGNPHDNRAENLKWGTVKENAEDRVLHNKGRKRLSDTQVRRIRKKLARGEDPIQIADDMGLSFMTVNGILQKRTYRHVR